ncbi:MAG: ribosome biogenesis GTPase Der [Thermodesulfovibrionaceae bacterium]
MFTVVIVGRPNVGKSTLFNRLIKGDDKIKAIIDKLPGVTRDINYGTAQWDEKRFTVIDTGGFFSGRKPQDIISRQMIEQIKEAIDEADLIIHLLDGKEGLIPDDIETAKKLRQTGKEILWVVNKIDDASKLNRVYEFYSLTDNLIAVSALTGYGFDDLLERILEKVKPSKTSHKEELPKIAIVGRPNVGKSTIVNALVGKKRMIVSPIPGTTRDAIDTVCTYYGKKYILIDTAGIKRLSYYKKEISQEVYVEKLSYFKALRSIEKCDIAILVIDSTEGIVHQDQRIAGYIEEQKKGLIILFNKWDLVPKEKREILAKNLKNEIERKLWFVSYAPYLTVSATEKTRLTKIFPLIDQILKEYTTRIQTSELNKIFVKKLKNVVLPSEGKELKFYYITQIDIKPPTFVVFVNDEEVVKQHHLKFIENIIRESFNFKCTPVKIKIKQRQ